MGATFLSRDIAANCFSVLMFQEKEQVKGMMWQQQKDIKKIFKKYPQQRQKNNRLPRSPVPFRSCRPGMPAPRHAHQPDLTNPIAAPRLVFHSHEMAFSGVVFKLNTAAKTGKQVHCSLDAAAKVVCFWADEKQVRVPAMISSFSAPICLSESKIPLFLHLAASASLFSLPASYLSEILTLALARVPKLVFSSGTGDAARICVAHWCLARGV